MRFIRYLCKVSFGFEVGKVCRVFFFVFVIGFGIWFGGLEILVMVGCVVLGWGGFLCENFGILVVGFILG